MTLDQDDEPLLNSEISWSFTNVHSQLLDAYPNGKALTDILTTVDGLYEWQIDFYPNGLNSKDNKINVVLTLKSVKDGQEVDAECNYYFIDKSSNKNYVGKIARRNFKANNCEQDSDFDNSILKECDADCMITFNITQYQNEQENDQVTQTANLVSSANDDSNINDDDFKKESVKQLF